MTRGPAAFRKAAVPTVASPAPIAWVSALNDDTSWWPRLSHQGREELDALQYRELGQAGPTRVYGLGQVQDPMAVLRARLRTR